MSHQDEPPTPTGSALFARKGAFIGLALALVVDLIGLALGLSDGGAGWAFEMPSVALCGLIGLTAGVGAMILSILRLIHQKGKETAMWVTLIGAGIAGLVGLFWIFLSAAASASV